MTAEAEVQEIQWVSPTLPIPEMPEPVGKHHAPEVSTESTEGDHEPRIPEDAGIPDVEARIPPSSPRGNVRTGGRRAKTAISAPAQPKSDSKKSPPKFTAPSFSEWHEYLSDFAIKWVCRAYIAFVFRGIDRYELLSTADNAALEPDEEFLSDIAKPIAHLAGRSKSAGKYGRLIMDSSDGIAALIQLTMWGNRVSRIAKKARQEERRRNGVVIPGEVISEEPSGESVPEPPLYARPGFHANGHGFN